MHDLISWGVLIIVVLVGATLFDIVKAAERRRMSRLHIGGKVKVGSGEYAGRTGEITGLHSAELFNVQFDDTDEIARFHGLNLETY